jgi:hypothetical protein
MGFAPIDPTSGLTALQIMNHAEFTIGTTFWCGERQWRCTDTGTRVIVAIRIDQVDVAGFLTSTLDQNEAERAGWFNGPPYAVAETVFDENDLSGCSICKAS